MIDCQFYAPAALYLPGRFLVLITVRGWVDPRVIVRLEGLATLKRTHLIGARSRDLPAFSIVPQPTTLPRAPVLYGEIHITHLCICRYLYIITVWLSIYSETFRRKYAPEVVVSQLFMWNRFVKILQCLTLKSENYKISICHHYKLLKYPTVLSIISWRIWPLLDNGSVNTFPWHKRSTVGHPLLK
jgi:hypothetical protein